MALTAWLKSEKTSPWMNKWQLDPISSEGRLAALRPTSNYRHLAEAAGFQIERLSEFTPKVAPTWGLIIRRLPFRLVTQSKYRRALIRGPSMNRDFSRALLRIWLAYRIGVMRYGLFELRKPGTE